MDGLLLIHAFPLDARMWGGQMGGDHTVAPDLPGFGATAMPDAGVLTMASAAARCLEELDAAGLNRAVVCGLSMGGYVAFELLRTAPERIAGLVLANTRAGVGVTGDRRSPLPMSSNCDAEAGDRLSTSEATSIRFFERLRTSIGTWTNPVAFAA